MEQFCDIRRGLSLCSVPSSMRKWGELDKGTIDYEEYMEECLAALPDRLADQTRAFFKDWPRSYHAKGRHAPLY